ncbi:MAG: LL-diaminopimelate aminotransferase [Victivallaceae bacterium]
MRRNSYFDKLSTDYFFRRISTSLRFFKKNNPDISIIDLSIGNPKEFPTSFVIDSICEHVRDRSASAAIIGYGPEEGHDFLRRKIADYIYTGSVGHQDIFVSDGAKCDIARMQLLFGPGRTIVLSDPCYPVYRDIALIGGSNIITLPCLKENNFIPEIEELTGSDYIFYICSPNNPIGNVWDYENLRKTVDFAVRTHSFIIFDAVYSQFIDSPDLPTSIYRIEGAERVAIELNSFSKNAGFAGIRLGWSVVPSTLRYRTGESVRDDWIRLLGSGFNGASVISQIGGSAYFDEDKTVRTAAVKMYRENARILKKAFESIGYNVFGGDHAPYLWIEYRDSHDIFDYFLKEYGITVTPGEGFGVMGRGFFRVSAFVSRKEVETVVSRLTESALMSC